jgi:uncharacterized protein YgiM (DUF1202 family)
MKFLLLSCMCIVFLAACSMPASGTAIPSPTELPSPTPQAQIPTSANTPIPSPMPTLAGLKYCVVPNLLNLRSGPGTQFSIVVIEGQGTCGQVTARNEDSSWVYFSVGKYNGWAFAKYLTGQGDIKSLPLSSGSTPTAPGASQTAGVTPTIGP